MKTLAILAILTITTLAETSVIKLPPPNRKGGTPLMEALNKRKTTRKFTQKKLSPGILSDLLWAGCGVNREKGKRTAPSAVNWQEIDIYVALEEGLYLYNPFKNQLELVLKNDIRKHTGKQELTDNAPVNLIYVADYSRMDTEKKQKDFYSATDTGFISQNIYLFCASENLGTVVIGWVDKINLKKIMNLKESQHVILTQSIGFPAQ